MGESLKPAESDLEKTLREVSGCEDKRVDLTIKKEHVHILKKIKDKLSSKKSSDNYTTITLYGGKVLCCEVDGILFAQGHNGNRNHINFQIIPFSAISGVEVYTKKQSIKRDNYE
ncbi:MAG: hypothetical protein JSW73_00015 [Candidatus Woesearchaeota archaeon]|nr:MAG: hypothetical protein JSW73_00015 [Candidatus Woesearchaeota archaeon]